MSISAIMVPAGQSAEDIIVHCAGHESHVIVTTQIREILAREPKPGTQCLSHQSVPVTRSC